MILVKKKAKAWLAAIMVSLSVYMIDQMPASAEDLIVGTRSEMTMDPHFFWSSPNRAYNYHIYGSLVRIDENVRPQPMIASTWELVDDNTWHFTIHPDAVFHNGSKVIAEDVVTSFNRAKNLENAAASYAGAMRGIASVEVIDNATVKISTSEPNPTLLHQVGQISIIPASFAANATQADFISGEAAIGAGPYELVEFRPGDRLMLKRNDAYFGEPAKWNTVTFRVISDDAARVAALIGGDVDLIDFVPPTDIARLQNEEGVTVHRGPTDRTMYLIPDVERERSPYVIGVDENPLRNPLVRKAMSLAINREALVNRIMDGAGQPATQFVAPAVLGHAADMPELKFDLAEAQSLLAEAGYADGFGLTIHCTNDRYVNDGRLCQAIGQMLSRLGLDMKVEALPKAIMFPKIRDHDGDRTSLMLLSFGSGTSGDAGGVLTLAVHTHDQERGFGAWNIGHYSNPDVDTLIERAASTFDAEERGKLQAQAVKITTEELGLIPLFYTSVVVATRTRLEYTIHADQATMADSVSVAR